MYCGVCVCVCLCVVCLKWDRCVCVYMYDLVGLRAMVRMLLLVFLCIDGWIGLKGLCVCVEYVCVVLLCSLSLLCVCMYLYTRLKKCCCG